MTTFTKPLIAEGFQSTLHVNVENGLIQIATTAAGTDAPDYNPATPGKNTLSLNGKDYMLTLKIWKRGGVDTLNGQLYQGATFGDEGTAFNAALDAPEAAAA